MGRAGQPRRGSHRVRHPTQPDGQGRRAAERPRRRPRPRPHLPGSAAGVLVLMAATRLLRVWLAARALAAGARRALPRSPISGRPCRRGARLPARSAAAWTSRCRRSSASAASTPPTSACRRRATAAIAAAAWSTWTRRRAPPSTRARSRTPASISATSSFVPHVLAIVAGTTVDFPNNDRTYHNVFSLSKTRSFDLGRYAAGPLESHPLRPARHRPRVLRHPFAHERVHPGVRAPLLRGDRRGRPVPHRQRAAGSYNVVAWNEAMPLDSRRAAVPEAGGEVELSFLFEKR